jgi:hypothetical protein
MHVATDRCSQHCLHALLTHRVSVALNVHAVAVAVHVTSPALRAALPKGQYLMSTATWHVGCYGVGAFKNSQPAGSQFVGEWCFQNRLKLPVPKAQGHLACQANGRPHQRLPGLPMSHLHSRTHAQSFHMLTTLLVHTWQSHIQRSIGYVPAVVHCRLQPCLGYVPCWPAAGPDQYYGL